MFVRWRKNINLIVIAVLAIILSACGKNSGSVESLFSGAEPLTAPPVPTLILKDPATHSVAFAKQVTVTAVITNDVSVAAWCMSESQTSAPSSGSAACVGGSGAILGWSTSAPTTFQLSTGDGLKTVYLWVA